MAETLENHADSPAGLVRHDAVINAPTIESLKRSNSFLIGRSQNHHENRVWQSSRAGLRNCCALELRLAKKRHSQLSGNRPGLGPTQKSATDFFHRVAGLDVVMLSYDVFHLEFISVDHYLNAINAAHAAGVCIFVNLCYSNSPEKDKLLKGLETVRELIYHIQFQPVLPFGNGAANVGTMAVESSPVNCEDDLFALSKSCVAGNSLLNRDGSFYACCWTGKVENSPLKYNHYRGLGFQFTSLAMEMDPAFQSVRNAGFIGSLSPTALQKLLRQCVEKVL